MCRVSRPVASMTATGTATGAASIRPRACGPLDNSGLGPQESAPASASTKLRREAWVSVEWCGGCV
jgi:hypothetical protein